MAPTMEVDSLPAGSEWRNISEIRLRGTASDPSDVSENYLNSRGVAQSSKSVIPEASPVFKEAMDKMKLERTDDVCKKGIDGGDNGVVPAQTASSSSPSFLTKLKSAFKSSSSLSPDLSPNRSEGLPSVSSITSRTRSSRRPASFGGSDVIKPVTERRASHSEKRVSWADERGSAHRLFSVRLIKPRLSTDTNRAHPCTPGQSILRNTGIC